MQTCAHRYLIVVGETPYPVGRCFFSGRTLENFAEYSPCEDGKKNENLYTSMHILLTFGDNCGKYSNLLLSLLIAPPYSEGW